MARRRGDMEATGVGQNATMVGHAWCRGGGHLRAQLERKAVGAHRRAAPAADHRAERARVVRGVGVALLGELRVILAHDNRALAALQALLFRRRPDRHVEAVEVRRDDVGEPALEVRLRRAAQTSAAGRGARGTVQEPPSSLRPRTHPRRS